MGQSQVTMDSGTAGRVMREGMFPRVKLERKTSPKRYLQQRVVNKSET